MFNGKIVEIAETEELLKNPIHPYTKRLISSIPVPDPTYERVVYDIDYTELDNIISTDTENIGMVDIGNEHFVATHDVKGILWVLGTYSFYLTSLLWYVSFLQFISLFISYQKNLIHLFWFLLLQ